MQERSIFDATIQWIQYSFSHAYAFFIGDNVAASPTSSPSPLLNPMPSSPKPAGIELRVIPSRALEKNMACTLAISLYNPATGQLLNEEELAVVHTKKLHLLIADQSLKDYHHLHPVASSDKGVFVCDFTPSTSHGYHVWADFTDERTRTNHTLHHELLGKDRVTAHLIADTSPIMSSGVSVQWNSDRPLRAHQDTILTVKLRDTASGEPIRNLSPLLGAYAHLVGFSADGRSMVHSHPIKGGEDTGTLRFHLNSPHSGATRFYLQINRAGQEITLPFSCMIAPKLTMQERVKDSSSPAITSHHHTH